MISCCRPVVRTLRVARTQLRRACNNPTSIRLFTSTAIPEKPEKVGYVEFANSVIARHPIECLASVVLLEYVAFNGSLHVIRMLGEPCSPLGWEAVSLSRLLCCIGFRPSVWPRACDCICRHTRTQARLITGKDWRRCACCTSHPCAGAV